MKAVKITAAIIVSIILIAAESILMGLFSVDKALSEDSIREALEETNITQRLADEMLSENTVNMGGKYEGMIKNVMQTDAMKDFFAAYIVSAVRSEVYGEPYEEIADDELMKSFSLGIDEVNNTGAVNISSSEEELLKQAMMKEIPDLTDKLNESIVKYRTTDSELAQNIVSADDDVKTMMSMKTRLILILVSVMSCAALVALFWRSRAGFLWCGIVTALTAAIYGLLTLLGEDVIFDAATASDSEKFVVSLVSAGFSAAAAACVVLAALFIVIYIILKIVNRRKTA